MSKLRQDGDQGVLVRFWALDHHRAEDVLWPSSTWHKLVYALEGTLQVQTSSTVHVLPPNRALCVAAGVPHPARTQGKARVRTIYFNPRFPFDRSRQVVEVRPLFRELINEACRIGPLREREARENAIVSLLIEELGEARETPSSIPMPHSEWVHDWAIAFLEDPASVTAPAYSRRTLERRILEETSLTLGQWCQQARALVGLRALSRGATVLEAALESGFETTSGFIQSFRRQFGITPGRMFRSDS